MSESKGSIDPSSKHDSASTPKLDAQAVDGPVGASPVLRRFILGDRDPETRQRNFVDVDQIGRRCLLDQVVRETTS